MNERIPTRTKSAWAVGLATLTVLAVLVAPVCAPLCAAKICASGSGRSQEKCHGMAAMGTDGIQEFFAAGKTCRAFELPVVIAKTDETVSLSRGARSDAPAAQIDDAYQTSQTLRFASADASPGRWPDHRTPFEADSLLLAIVLRI